MKDPLKVKQGKNSRIQGARFELKVREYLESEGWIVSKWQNNVDLDKKCLTKALMGKYRSNQGGFPDFIAYKRYRDGAFEVIGVECKMNRKLSKLEKEKSLFLIEKGVFSDVWLASKEKVGIRVGVCLESLAFLLKK